MTTITDTTPVTHTAASTTVKALFTGQFRGARIRVKNTSIDSPQVEQLIPKREGGIITEPTGVTYTVGVGEVLTFTAQDVGSPAPSITLTIVDA